MTILILTFFAFLNREIKGTVIDKSSSQPVKNANIQIIELGKSAVTNAEGKFVIKNIPDGKYTFKISHIGYKSVEITFSTENGIVENNIFLEPQSQLTEEVIIQGIRADENMPVSQKTLTKAEIEQNYFGQEMPVLLSQTPSVNYYSDGGNFTGYSYMRLRGIDQTRINFTMNGLPISEPEDQGVYFANFADFGNSIQSVQVQRGVGTSTSGTASYAGSVNFESMSLMDSVPSAELQLGRGSYNSYRISPEFSTGLMKNRLAFYGRYSLVGSDGYRYHSGTQANSFFMSGGYFGEKDLLKITAFSGRTKNNLAYIATSLDDIHKDPKTNYLSNDEKDEFSQDLVQLQYTRKLGNYTSMVASGYYIKLSGGYDIKFDSLTLQNFAVKSDFGGMMLTVNTIKNKFKSHVGIHANAYRRDHFSALKPFISNQLYYNSGYKNELSAFAKLNYEIGKLNFFGDAQIRTVYFHYQPDKNAKISVNDISWTFFNPKIGFTYQLHSNLNVFASAGKTSREPTRNDMFAGFDDIDNSNITLVGDFTKVKPESVIDFEAGANLVFQNLVIQANVYDMQFKNEIAAIGQLSYIGLPLRKNVPKSYRRGLEWDVKWRVTPHFSFSQNTTFQYSQIKEYSNDSDGKTYHNIFPLLSPKWILNQNISYFSKKSSVVNWGAEISGRYVSESFLANDNDSRYVTPAFFLLNFRANLDFFKPYKITFLVNNLTDKQYFTSGYIQNNQPFFFAQAKRNYFVTLSFKF